MKKYLFLLFILFVNCHVVFSQTTSNNSMLYYFSQQPDSIYPYLSSNNKLDLVDFIAADMDAVVVNKLDGNTKLEVVDSTFIKLQLNPATLVEMKLLPTTINLKDSSKYVISVLTTYGVNAKESTISFYTSKWNKCNVHDPLKDIRINDLFDKSKTANGKDVKKIMKIPEYFLLHASFDEGNSLLLKLSTNKLLEEDNNSFKAILGEKRLFWNGRSFK